MNDAGDAIRVNGLTKTYGGRFAVKDLTFSVKSGMVFGLLGANGAGKSTTIDCILGTKQKDTGEISVLGMDPKKDRRRLFQMVGVQFQEGDYQNEIRVEELCEETACLYRHPADWHQLLQRFGIGDKEKQPVKSLSGGERQRLFIVLALIPNPKLVFLDELTTGLDARARRSVWEVLEGLKQQGLTVFLTSHFMDEVEALCDEICILKKGSPVFYGTVAQAKKQCGCDKFEDAYLMLSDEEEAAE
ncbi:MAG: ABC transporter ATP-binding protein [Bacillota bacterium]|nr:ABC transporter ATP-binding protein [Bacillota bacterium]